MKIKICSSNIRYETEQDGINQWCFRRPLLANFINTLELDILGTQEGRELQIRSLADEINLVISDEHRKWIDVRMYPTLFYNPKTVEVIESNDFWLSETPHVCGSSSFQSAFPRLATWIKIIIKENQKKYLVINTHLDHVLNETRISQAKVLIEMINKINTEQLPIILMGDFNDNFQSETHHSLANQLNLKDIWLEKKQDEETSHHGFQGKNFLGHRIDWILTSSQFNCEEVYFYKESFNGVYLSDHFPLVATVIPN